jgi:hypothetical protein
MQFNLIFNGQRSEVNAELDKNNKERISRE